MKSYEKNLPEIQKSFKTIPKIRLLETMLDIDEIGYAQLETLRLIERHDFCDNGPKRIELTPAGKSYFINKPIVQWDFIKRSIIIPIGISIFTSIAVWLIMHFIFKVPV